MLETALNEEMTEHLGYEKHDPAGVGADNIRNGTRPKTVLTETAGPVQIDVSRDRASTFTPQIVRKRQRRLSGVDEIVLSAGSGILPAPIWAADCPGWTLKGSATAAERLLRKVGVFEVGVHRGQPIASIAPAEQVDEAAPGSTTVTCPPAR